jgi:hypothetical protein
VLLPPRNTGCVNNRRHRRQSDRSTTETIPPQNNNTSTPLETHLQGMNVEDDHTGGAPPADGDVGQDAAECECGRDIALVLHSLRGAGRKERQHQGEAGYKHAREGVYDGDLLEDDGRAVEGRQECHVAVADVVRAGDKEVGEAVGKAPAQRWRAFQGTRTVFRVSTALNGIKELACAVGKSLHNNRIHSRSI